MMHGQKNIKKVITILWTFFLSHHLQLLCDLCKISLNNTCGSITSHLNCIFSSSDAIYMTHQVWIFFFFFFFARTFRQLCRNFNEIW
jgi:hypothetical protein